MNFKGKLNPNYKHGFKGTRFYGLWKTINTRCNNSNRKFYFKYGGSGIKSEWSNSFLKFKEDMYESYLEHVKKFGEKETTIDRIKNDKNYCKSNCRWATRKEQPQNRKITIRIKFKNRIQTLEQWSKELGINYQTLYGRLFVYKMNKKKAFNKKYE